MTAKTIFAVPCLLYASAVALASCTYSRPPQTGFYCVDIPEGRSADASRFVRTVADRLNFKVSEAQFPSEKGPPHHVWEVYGKGVSMSVGTAMKDGKPDRFGNRETTFNPNRLGFNVAKTGLWQRVRFDSRQILRSSTWVAALESSDGRKLLNLKSAMGRKQTLTV